MHNLPPSRFSDLITSHPVLLLSSRSGRTNTITPLTWYLPQSNDPPLIGVSLKPSTLSYRHVREAGDFILGIPGPAMLKTVHFCGIHTGKDVDKITSLGLSTTRGRDVSPLMLTDAIANFECKVREFFFVGNRPLITAEVLSVSVNSKLYDDGWLPHARLIHYEGGNTYRIGNETIDMSHLRPGYILYQ